MDDAETDTKMIMKLAPLIKEFYSAQNNMSYAQMHMVAIMEAVYDKAAWAQVETKPRRAEWTESVAKQLRCMFRHVAQALRRKQQPKWLAKLGLECAAADD
eukprot:2442095-Lingulodinium_polyedra.AAC.1